MPSSAVDNFAPPCPPVIYHHEVVCAGVACVDVELGGCAVPATLESITHFERTRYAAGGSAPQTSRAFASLGFPTVAVYPAADDAHGRALAGMLVAAGVAARPTVDGCSDTALAVLPVFTDGRRGCYVSLGANLTITADSLVPDDADPRTLPHSSPLLHEYLRAFHLGYPHLLPRIQGAALRKLLERVRRRAPYALISLDVNGADVAEGSVSSERDVLSSALPLVDVVHANAEEACVISGLDGGGARAATLGYSEMASLARWFVDRGARAAFVTCGKDGVIAAGRCVEAGDGGVVTLHRSAFSLRDGIAVNASGAGDSFAAGAVAGMLEFATGDNRPLGSLTHGVLRRVADAGLASAVHRLDPMEAGTETGIVCLLEKLKGRPRIATRLELVDSSSAAVP
jgi:sugar/nucleoside kinase (ribokinase family)